METSIQKKGRFHPLGGSTPLGVKNLRFNQSQVLFSERHVGEIIPSILLLAD